jgi:hypothetical protein
MSQSQSEFIEISHGHKEDQYNLILKDRIKKKRQQFIAHLVITHYTFKHIILYLPLLCISVPDKPLQQYIL